MRTTLDLDDVVLAAARAKARADGTSLGRAVSALAREGTGARAVSRRSGFPTFAEPGDHVITEDLVERYRDDE